MKRYIVLRIYLFVSIILLFNTTVFADWFDPDWSSRRPVIINNTSNSDTLYDFQVGINSPHFTGMQGDFDDARFTIDDGITSIPYWIEEYNPSDYAIFWVKVPLIPALDTTIIYLYYGNPDAVSESDGEAVFDYFDDFDDQDIGDWSIIYGEWTAFNKYLEQSNTANHCRILSLYPITYAAVSEAKMVYISSYHYSGIHILFSKDFWGTSGYKFGYAGLNVGGSRIFRIDGEWFGVNLVTDPTINVIDYPYVWLKAKATYDGTGNLSLLLRTPDSIEVFLEAYDITFSLPFYLGTYCGSHIGIDDLRVRKHTIPEPTYSIGEEQGIIEDHVSYDLGPAIPKLSLISSHFNFPVKFQLKLPRNSKVSANIYDCSGRKILFPIKSQHFKKGTHHLYIKRGNQDISTGIFFLRLTINECSGEIYFLNEKLVLLQ